MHRILTVLVTGSLLATSCGGDSGGGDQPQTEAAAIEAVTKAVRGTFVNRSGDVLALLSEECRAAVDENEIRQALAFARAFMQSDEFDLSDVEVRGTATEFSTDAATIEVEFVAPEGADLGMLELSEDEIDVVYENGRWVNDDCDFDDMDADPSADLRSELEALGLAGTQDDPVPAELAAPIGDGFTVAVTDYTADAFDVITRDSGSEPYLEDGEQIALLAYDIGYAGDAEPAGLSQVNLQLVGTDGVAIDQTSCGDLANQLYFGSRQVFSGAKTSVVTCFSASPDRLPETPLVSINATFGVDDVFFSPTVVADSPTSVTGSTGPSPDGDLSDDRTSPNPVATAVEIGDGWTLTVNDVDTDAAAAITAQNDVNDPAPEGSTYVLVDVTLAYDGDGDGEGGAASLYSTEIGLVGDSNVSADSECGVIEVPDGLDLFDDIFPGGSVSGNLCFVVSDDDLDSLLVYASGETFSDDWEFFAID